MKACNRRSVLRTVPADAEVTFTAAYAGVDLIDQINFIRHMLHAASMACQSLGGYEANALDTLLRQTRDMVDTLKTDLCTALGKDA